MNRENNTIVAALSYLQSRANRTYPFLFKVPSEIDTFQPDKFSSVTFKILYFAQNGIRKFINMKL